MTAQGANPPPVPTLGPVRGNAQSGMPAGTSLAESLATGAPHIRVDMLSCPRFLAGAREMVASLARRLGFDETAACQIALAVDEALANVIRHGYQRREDQPIWMSIWQLTAESGAGTPGHATAVAGHSMDARGGGLLIVIEDQGAQAEPETIKGRDLEDIRPGGLGVHIIREVMDQVVYEKRIGGGMRLTLVKRLEPLKDASKDRGNHDGADGGQGAGSATAPTNAGPGDPSDAAVRGEQPGDSRGTTHG